ncbi:hypothetical protein IQ06DRAFT_233576 [Phaeosphaeriaceae sp. SRC1lsM3a]|nr:hypothetical protein IQ06DRAFT_233576 [Stagonospora sp. SRC1lsM3a]
MPQPLSESDILFPHLSNTPSFSSTLSSLKRSALSIHNRLTSITSDSTFVTSVASAYQLPLVANERCGSWYISPSKKIEGVYFKSTDGHMGEWAFSLRRLNLQLLDVVAKYGGAVVVDSTRRGKSMPDALSKTVPIWCCVMNRVVFGNGDKGDDRARMYTPPQAVSESERSQIEGRIDGFVRQFLDICKPKIPELREKIRKPLRPIWITQQSSLPGSPPEFADFHPVVLCTASRRVHGAEASEGGYVQGAADDHEAWSHGLTPPVFWKNKDLLLRTSEEDAPGVIAKLLAEDAAAAESSSRATLIKPTSSLFISPSDNIDLTGYDVVVTCTPDAISSAALKSTKIKHYLHLKCQTGKLGSRDLRNELAQLPDFLSSLSSPTSTPNKILICCPTGKDLSVGAALAVLCLYTDANGVLDFANRKDAGKIDKNFIKQRLSWITTSNPSLNPSRSTLQSVNAALLTSQDPKAMSLPPPLSAPRAEKEDATLPQPELPSLPSAIFTSLLNSSQPWTFTRSLTSALPTHPSGTVSGTATFTPCPSLTPHSPPTLLYAEEGEFVTSTGLKMSTRRRYVYQLVDPQPNEGIDGKEGVGEDDSGTRIVVKFFDDEKYPKLTEIGGNGEGIGGVFVEMGRITPLATTSPSLATATVNKEDDIMVATNRARHLCGADLYAASWKFNRGMLGNREKGTMGGTEDKETWWEVRYEVKGPKKDYVSVTRYTR